MYFYDNAHILYNRNVQTNITEMFYATYYVNLFMKEKDISAICSLLKFSFINKNLLIKNTNNVKFTILLKLNRLYYNIDLSLI